MFHEKLPPTKAFEMKMLPILAQARAALLPCPAEVIITKLAVLKVALPGQRLSEEETAVLFEEYAEQLTKRDYSAFSIMEGCDYILAHEDFFPTLKKLIGAVHKIHWQLKLRADMIEEMILRRHTQLAVEYRPAEHEPQPKAGQA